MRGSLILIVIIICIIISTGSFAWGYWQAGYDEAARWIIASGVLWLVALWRKWKWFSALVVFLSLSLAAFGIWFNFSLGWVLIGAVFAFFAWDLTEFDRKLKLLFPREDARGMTRRHLARVGFLAAGVVLMALILNR